jgi:hypothetical protein
VTEVSKVANDLKNRDVDFEPVNQFPEESSPAEPSR